MFKRNFARNATTFERTFARKFARTKNEIRAIRLHYFCTVLYAVEQIGTHQSYAQPDGIWQDTMPDEINRLITLLIYFGLVKVGTNFDRYWSVKTLYHGLWARAIMSRLRYRALMALLHVVDPGKEAPDDKLHKVESFINYFKSKCRSLYQPRQHLNIDERMVNSRHRSGIRQYIKDKLTKWGIKLWVLADSSNGYTIDFNVHIGKAAVGEVSKHGLGYDVVMRVMQPFLNQGYRLYVDNFYTSVALMNDLFAQRVPATGTIVETRRGFPENLKNGKQWAKGLRSGKYALGEGSTLPGITMGRQQRRFHVNNHW